MNKSNLTGFVLIFAIMMGFSWYQSRQHSKQMEAQAQLDSIARVEQMAAMAVDSMKRSQGLVPENDIKVHTMPAYKDSLLTEARLAVESFHKLSNIKAKVLLATTPNIGTGGYPVKRSPHVMKMFHVFHAFADCSAYHIGSLDNYDTVLTVGPHQEKPIREVEKARGLKEKDLIPAGLPYFLLSFRHPLQ